MFSPTDDRLLDALWAIRERIPLDDTELARRMGLGSPSVLRHLRYGESLGRFSFLLRLLAVSVAGDVPLTDDQLAFLEIKMQKWMVRVLKKIPGGELDIKYCGLVAGRDCFIHTIHYFFAELHPSAADLDKYLTKSAKNSYARDSLSRFPMGFIGRFAALFFDYIELRIENDL